MFDDDEIIQGFIEESFEALDQTDPMLVELSDAADGGGAVDQEVLNSIFRLFHTMKGGAGFLNLNNVVSVTHEGETLLDLFRSGEGTLTPAYANLLLQSSDLVRKLIEQIEQNGSDDGIDGIDEMTQKLKSAIDEIKNGGGMDNEQEEPETASGTDEDKALAELDKLFGDTGETPAPFVPDAEEEPEPVSAEDLSSEEEALANLDKMFADLETDEEKESSSTDEEPSKEEALAELDNIFGDLEDTGVKEESEPEEAAAETPTDEPADEFDEDFFADFKIEITPEMTEKFVAEGTDLMEEAELGLIQLEKNPGDSETVTNVMRQLHTFKGNCGFFSYKDLERISHVSESILVALDEGQLKVESDTIQMLLNVVDCIKEALVDLSEGKGCDIPGIDPMVDLLSDVLKDEDGKDLNIEAPPANVSSAPSKVEEKEPVKEEPVKEVAPEPEPKQETAKAEVAAKPVKSDAEYIVLVVDQNKSSISLAEKILEKNNIHVISATTASEAFSVLESNENTINVCLTGTRLSDMLGLEFISKLNNKYSNLPVIVMSGNDEKDLLKDLLKMEVYGFVAKPIDGNQLVAMVGEAYKRGWKKKITSSSGADVSSAVQKSTSRNIVRRDIRVDLDKLDKLVNLVGELIIYEAMVTNNPDLDGMDLPNFDKAAHNLHLVTNELQDIAMAVRMVPVAGMFRKMIRLVHDLSNKAGKKLKLHLLGEDTEIDKSVLDQIADPLVHMIRNSGDHGVESPDERAAAGKPAVGNITLEAKQQGNEVLIIVRDDGRGLNREKILAKAISNGLVDGDGSNLSDGEVFELIFAPGFSTAEKVTDISGRGVGMDVVKKNIEKVKGRIEISSVLGKGSEFTIKIPLTLATIEGMLVRVGKSKYTIPITSIRESFQPNVEDVTIRPDGQEFVNIREQVLPVFRLHSLHNIKADYTEIHEGILIVLELNDTIVCLLVDEIIRQLQTVIKTMEGYFGRIKGIYGYNILGDGEVALILDVNGLFRLTKSTNSGYGHSEDEETKNEEESELVST